MLALFVFLSLARAQQPPKCEDDRDQLVEHLKLVHNERVARESQIAALSVTIRRLEEQNGQLKAKLQKYEEKKADETKRTE